MEKYISVDSKKFIVIIERYLYKIATNCFSWWPLELSYFRQPSKLKIRKTAYYLLRYPHFSQTFIQREVIALKSSGLKVRVFANKIDDEDKLEEEAKSLIENTIYLYPLRKKRLHRYKEYFYDKNKIRYINLFLYVLFHRYENNKSLKSDIKTFVSAIYLAGRFMDGKFKHVHSPWANKSAFVALIASRFIDITYSVEARASEINRNDMAYGLKEKFRNANFVLTNSLYNKLRIEKYLKKSDRNKVFQIYEGIDLKRFKPITETNNTNTKIIYILCVGRFIEEKGLVYLLKACKILKDNGINFKCNIVGGKVEGSSDDYFSKIQKLYLDLQLSDNVQLNDARPFDEILEMYTNADIFVLPCVISKQHGGKDITPNVLFEAMAMKLPVISTNITAIPEIIDNGVDGILVLPEDHLALGDAIIKLIEDGNLRKRLGENARKKIEQKFDINKNIKEFVHLFR